MKLSTSTYIAKLMLINLSAAFLVGISYHADSATIEMASSAEASFSIQDVLNDNLDEAIGVAPVISHALDQVQQANKYQSFMGWLDNTANRDCPDCAKQIENMRYGQCNETSRDGYLEKQLQATSAQEGLLGALIRQPVNQNAVIKPICIQMSMQMASSGLPRSAFKSCNGDRYGSAVGPACVGENYFKLINNSFDTVSNCMKDFIAPGESEEMQKLDIRAAYALINVESGFHVNAVSGTGAGGIGQFTSAAITDVNANQIPAVKRALEADIGSVCSQVSSEFLKSSQPIRNNSNASCDRISLKNGNPVKNMIYTFAYLRGVKSDLNKQIFMNSNYSKKFNVSEYDLARIKRAMMVWSHNTGAAGTMTPVKALLNSFYRNKPVTDADKFINQIQQYMQIFPARANAGASRRKETSGYFPAITERLHNIESNAGGGSCVN